MNDFMKNGIRWVRRTAVAIVGALIVLAGIVMIFLPGPGMVIIPAGLAVLAAEFAWAKTLLDKLKEKAGTIVKKYRKGSDPGSEEER